VLPRRLLLLMLVPFVLILAGTVGYYVLEPEYSWLDSLYMTVMTVTTVGYGEPHKLSPIGKIFTIFLMLGGIFTLFYAMGEVIRAIVSGEVKTIMGRQQMEQALSRLTAHLIVCGYGRMGELVCREFATQKESFVVIERDANRLENFKVPHGIPLHGDATSDEILRLAGVERARALVTVLASDADNLFITMSARLLNDQLFIVTRAEDDRTVPKLQRAGANRIVSPYAMGGYRVAHAVLRPTVVDFLDLAIRSEHLELQIEETQIAAQSKLAGTTIKDSRIRQELGVIVVAIKKATGEMVFNPPFDALMEAGDILITMGHREQVDQLEKLARG
jgi:voltage-gated potassium channel